MRTGCAAHARRVLKALRLVRKLELLNWLGMANKRSERGFGQLRRGGGAGYTVRGGDIEQGGGEFGRARDNNGMVKGRERLEKEQIWEWACDFQFYVHANLSQDQPHPLRTSISSSPPSTWFPTGDLPPYRARSFQVHLRSTLASELGTTRPQQHQVHIVLQIHRPCIYTRPIRRGERRTRIFKACTPLQRIQRHNTLEAGRDNALFGQEGIHA